VILSDGTPDWYGLGPVSVLPAYQRQGIGKALIGEGLARLKTRGARGCCLVAHPEYYRTLGFQNAPGLVHAGVPPEVFLALSFDGRMQDRAGLSPAEVPHENPPQDGGAAAAWRRSPSAPTTLSTVANSGLPAGESAL
jgi:putative acetyltransferase